MISKYQQLKNLIFPPDSTRKIAMKFFLKLLQFDKKTYSFIKYNNIIKTFRIIKSAGLRQLLLIINYKLDMINLCSDTIYMNDNINAENTDLVTNIVDIVIPIYNALDYTKKCIDTVYKNTTVKYNLYLVNDFSTDTNIKKFLQKLDKGIKPKFLQELYIINNQKNRGFIESVNSVLRISKNDIVLLNTDTEVPRDWLQRLYRPIYRDRKVASVTPFSNSATICSYPRFCQDNDLPSDLSLGEIDNLFREYGGNIPYVIPTGVGFCMMLNRDCIKNIGVLDVVYGKGYGEENDWCMRAIKNGYQNVMITNLFVYHKHGASFGTRNDKPKELRLKENLKILNKRYPQYNTLVGDYIAKDPVEKIREFVECVSIAYVKSSLEGILFVGNIYGGGTKVYQDRLISKWRKSKRIYSIELLADNITILFKVYSNFQVRKFNFNLNLMGLNEFKSLLKAFDIKLIYINQLISYPMDKIIYLIQNSNCRYIFFIHDFYAVCPNYTLLNANGIFCDSEMDENICNRCLKLSHVSIKKDIKEWRERFHKFLFNAVKVYAPSNSTASIINRYYPDINVIVREHEKPYYLYNTFNDKFLTDNVLTVSILGAIGTNKGSKIIYELVNEIRKFKLAINIKVIGITDLQSEYYKSKDGILEITGRYNNNKVSLLLAQYRTAIVMIPSIWPETYSYTVSESLYSGYPVLSFNIGAHAERIKKINGGWVIDEISVKSIFTQIKYLNDNRNKILEKHKNIVKTLVLNYVV